MALKDFLFYEEPGITLYCGDALEILPHVYAETIITDPVWPNFHPELIGSSDPRKLFGAAMKALPQDVARILRVARLPVGPSVS